MPFLPAWLLLRDRYHPAAWMKDYRGPVAIVLAGADEVIPPKLGQRLYDGLTCPKKIQVIAGAHHNEVAAQSPGWWNNIFSFWEEHRSKISP